MILVGTPNVVLSILNEYRSIPFVVLNLNSNSMQFPAVNLYPSGLFDPNSPDFDAFYHNAILSNTYSFFEFMKIILPLEKGCNVALLIYEEPTVINSVTESLLKLIQLRYGYNYQWVNSIDDFNPYDRSDFTVNGVYALDLDIDRYVNLSVANNIDVVNANDTIISECHI